MVISFEYETMLTEIISKLLLGRQFGHALLPILSEDHIELTLRVGGERRRREALT
jgi:hypothetical protein